MASLRKFWLPQSIVTRLTTWYAASLFILILGATGFLYGSLTKILAAEENIILRDRVEAIFSLLKNKANPIEALKQRVELEWANRRFEHIYVKIMTNQNKIVVATPDVPKEIEGEIFSRLALTDSESNYSSPKRLKTSNGDAYLVLVSRIESKDLRANDGKLFVVLDLRIEKEILNKYFHFFLFALAMGFMAATIIGFRLAHLSFAPVQKIIDITKRIRSSSLHERVADKNLPTELKNLAQTINEMLDRLEDSFGRLSRFSSDLAHELRTPINNIQGEIQVAISQDRSLKDYQDVILSVHEEVLRMSKMVDSLLFLAKSENPELQLKKERFNLRKEVLNISDFYEASAGEEEIKIQVEIPDDLELIAEKNLFQRALGNLISNSINYTPRGGSIRIKALKSSTEVVIIVEDTGHGIPDKNLPLVFDRFFRVDSSRTATKLGGFGLGLTIVKSIMTLHRGKVSIASQLGKGTEVTLQFPN